MENTFLDKYGNALFLNFMLHGYTVSITSGLFLFFDTVDI